MVSSRWVGGSVVGGFNKTHYETRQLNKSEEKTILFAHSERLWDRKRKRIHYPYDQHFNSYRSIPIFPFILINKDGEGNLIAKTTDLFSARNVILGYASQDLSIVLKNSMIRKHLFQYTSEILVDIVNGW